MCPQAVLRGSLLAVSVETGERFGGTELCSALTQFPPMPPTTHHSFAHPSLTHGSLCCCVPVPPHSLPPGQWASQGHSQLSQNASPTVGIPAPQWAAQGSPGSFYLSLCLPRVSTFLLCPQGRSSHGCSAPWPRTAPEGPAPPVAPPGSPRPLGSACCWAWMPDQHVPNSAGKDQIWFFFPVHQGLILL